MESAGATPIGRAMARRAHALSLAADILETSTLHE